MPERPCAVSIVIDAEKNILGVYAKHADALVAKNFMLKKAKFCERHVVMIFPEKCTNKDQL